MSTANTINGGLRNKLETGATELGIELKAKQLDSLIEFITLLKKWNKVYNLTAVRSVEEMVGRHILDSLSVLRCLPEQNASNYSGSVFDVLDVGTGAGLPVIPLAILRPDLAFLSVESAGKKTRFQQQAIVELGLANVQVKQARIEDVQDRASTIVSRAFTAPEKFLRAIEKNCLSGTQIIVMLGAKEKMPNQLPPGFTLLNLTQVHVPRCESARHIALCQINS